MTVRVKCKYLSYRHRPRKKQAWNKRICNGSVRNNCEIACKVQAHNNVSCTKRVAKRTPKEHILHCDPKVGRTLFTLMQNVLKRRTSWTVTEMYADYLISKCTVMRAVRKVHLDAKCALVVHILHSNNLLSNRQAIPNSNKSYCTQNIILISKSTKLHCEWLKR